MSSDNMRASGKEMAMISTPPLMLSLELLLQSLP
jgi:hypothetical protein